MKTIENKKTNLKKDEENFHCYGDMIQIVVNSPSQSGYTTTEMRERLRIIDAVADLTAEEYQLEDADYNKLMQLLPSCPWGVIHTDIVAFEDYLKSVGASKCNRL